MTFECNKQEGLIICSISGEVDMYAAPEFFEKYKSLAVKDPECALVFDLSGTTYMDSSGIGVLFQSFSDARLRKKAFCICNVSGMVEKLFRLSHMNSILPIEKTIENAIRKVRGNA